MGLLQNGYRHMLKGKLFGATALDGANPSVLLNRFNQAAPIRNQFVGDGIGSNYAAKPSGHLHPSAWMMPQKPGDMSSRNEAEITFSTSAIGVMGFPIVGSAAFSFSAPDADILPVDDTSPARTASASFTINFLDAEGQLISSGSGSASMEISTNTPLLTASISGDGSTSFSITTNNPILGAEASGAGTAALSFSVSGAMLPIDDTPPARTGSAVITISGGLTPYAIGNMIGTTDVVTELTTDAIAAAVWNAIAASFNDAGTMGNKLNTASSGGVDMDALAQTVWEYALRSMPATERAAVADAVWAKELP